MGSWWKPRCTQSLESRPCRQTAGPGGRLAVFAVIQLPRQPSVPTTSAASGGRCDHRHESQPHAGMMIISLVTTVSPQNTAFRRHQAIGAALLIFLQLPGLPASPPSSRLNHSQEAYLWARQLVPGLEGKQQQALCTLPADSEPIMAPTRP